MAQELPPATRVWSVGPLTKSEPVMGVSFGSAGAAFTGPFVDSQTRSTFAATRSVVFAGDRVVFPSMIRRRTVEGTQVIEEVYELVSLDVKTGEVKDSREISASGSLKVFAANDAHVILVGRRVMRLTPDLKDAGSFDYDAGGHKYGRVENISPDGSTLGNSTSPGFELIDARTLKATEFTAKVSADTSVNSRGFVKSNMAGLITYTDAAGAHVIYQGECAGRPQFLTDDLVFVNGCNNLLILDTRGIVKRRLSPKGVWEYAGVSLNGKRFALEAPFIPGRHERFVIYSVDSGEPVTEVIPDLDVEGQSWTAFSPDGSMFVVGSPLKLTLYRLP